MAPTTTPNQVFIVGTVTVSNQSPPSAFKNSEITTDGGTTNSLTNAATTSPLVTSATTQSVGTTHDSTTATTEAVSTTNKFQTTGTTDQSTTQASTGTTGTTGPIINPEVFIQLSSKNPFRILQSVDNTSFTQGSLLWNVVISQTSIIL